MTTRRTFLGSAAAGVAVGLGALAGLAGLPKRVGAKELNLGRTVEDTATFQIQVDRDMVRRHPGMLERFQRLVDGSPHRPAMTLTPTIDGRFTLVTAQYRYQVPEALQDKMRQQLAENLVDCLVASMASAPKPPPTYSPIIDELKPLLDRGIPAEVIAANLRNLSARWVF